MMLGYSGWSLIHLQSNIPCTLCSTSWLCSEDLLNSNGNASVFLFVCQFCVRNQNTYSMGRKSDHGVHPVVWWLLTGPIRATVSTGNAVRPCTWMHKEWTVALHVELWGQVDCRQCDAQWGHHLGTEKGQNFYLRAGEDLQNAERIALILFLERQGSDCLQASSSDINWYKVKSQNSGVRAPCVRAGPFFNLPFPPHLNHKSDSVLVKLPSPCSEWGLYYSRRKQIMSIKKYSNFR